MALLVPLAAADRAPESRDAVPRVNLPVETYTLDNGLRVILSLDRSAPTVATNVWYHVGAAQETKGSYGFAHLFEHVMFTGSGHIPAGEMDRLVDAVGSYTNASTSFDYTNYFVPDLPPDRLDLALWFESDRMAYLLDTLDAGQLANQQAVVRNERRQTTEQTPYGLTDEEVYHQLFPVDHPYHGNVIGSHEDVQAANLDAVRAFFRTYYVPNNASLAVAGNFDPVRTKEMIEKYFGSIPRGPEPPAPTFAPVSPVQAEKSVRLTDAVPATRVTMAWLSPAIYAPGDAEADLSASLLATGENSVLYRRLVRELRLAQEVTAVQYSSRHPSVFVVSATAKPGVTVEQLRAGVDAELAKLRTEGPAPADLEAARNTRVTELVRGLEDLGTRAQTLNQYNDFLGNPDSLSSDLARYAAVSAESMQTFARDQLRPSGRVVIDTVPGKRMLPPDPKAPKAPPIVTPPSTTKEAWRATVPEPGPAVTVAQATIERFELANGMPVYLVPSRGLPLVTASVVSRYGSTADPADKPGTATFLAAMLRQGTADLTADQVAARAARFGGTLSSLAETNATSVTVHALAAHATEATDLVASLVRDPAFRAADRNRLAGDLTGAVRQLNADADETATIAGYAAAMGPGSPYGHVSEGTVAGLEKVTVEDLAAFHGRAFTPNQAALVLAGDLTEDRAREIAEAAFGTWSGSSEAPPAPPAPAAIAQRVVLVDSPEAGQTALRIVGPGLPATDPEFETFQVGNQILGGLFSSRLNQNLREQKGWSYGVYSQLARGRGVGPYVAGGSVDRAATAPAIAEILKEISRLRAEDVSAEEFERGRQSLVGATPTLFATTELAASTTRSMFVFDLPTDYYAKRAARLSGLTPAVVREVYARRVDPATMKIAAVGDAKTIRKPIEALKLGDIVDYGEDGLPRS
ncbi:MAG: M16 family metallopeptidase [Sporichthyaceae bacterium]